MKEIRFVDTTLRDGQQSLWAYGMRTGMIVPIADHLDNAGFEAIELGGPVELPKCVRELREDPWERYRLVLARIKKTPLRVIHGTRSGFAITRMPFINSTIAAWRISELSRCASPIRGMTRPIGIGG